MASCLYRVKDINLNEYVYVSEETMRKIYDNYHNKGKSDGKVEKTDNFPKKNLFTVKPKQSVDKKAITKASIATQYIGFGEGIKNSSTELYREQAGKYANTGNYSPDDVIFVSVSGRRGNKELRNSQQDKTIEESIKALENGATLITDNAVYVKSNSYNEGEKRLSDRLTKDGYLYSEVTIDGHKLGVWNKQKTTEQQSENDTSTLNTEGIPKEQKSESINIYAGSNQNAELSNFAIRPFTTNVETPSGEKQYTFQSVEQGFHFHKALVANNPQVAKQILATTNGSQLKRLTNRSNLKMTAEQVKEWDNTSKSIMLNLMYDSYAQNPKVAEKLLATGDAKITHTQDNTRWKTDFPEVVMTVRDMLKEEGLVGNTNTNVKKEYTKQNFIELADKFEKVAKLKLVEEGKLFIYDDNKDVFDKATRNDLINRKGNITTMKGRKDVTTYLDVNNEIENLFDKIAGLKNTSDFSSFKTFKKEPRLFLDALKEDNDSENYRQVKQVIDNINSFLNIEDSTQDEIVETKESETDKVVYDKKYELFPGVYANKDQRNAIDELQEFLSSDLDAISLTGRGGTGKTTIIKKVVNPNQKGVVYVAPTHKAKNILNESVFDGQSRAVTLASLLGIKLDEGTGEFAIDPYAKEPGIKKALLIIIDESSMVGDELYDFIMENKRSEAKVIFMGDDVQLPPVGQETTSKSLLIKGPNLQERMRQDGNSPILPLSDIIANNVLSDETQVRVIKERKNKFNKESNEGLLFTNDSREFVDSFIKDFNNDPKNTRIITYNNQNSNNKQSVKTINAVIRKFLNPDNENNVVKGDQLTAYNTKLDRTGTFPIVENSVDYTVQKSSDVSTQNFTIEAKSKARGYRTLDLKIEGQDVSLINNISGIPVEETVFVPTIKGKEQLQKIIDDIKRQNRPDYQMIFKIKEQISDFEFSYAITSHKSQGSTYRNTYVLEDNILGGRNRTAKTKNKSLYVAVSRASKKLVIHSLSSKQSLNNFETLEASSSQTKTETDSKITLNEVLENDESAVHSLRGYGNKTIEDILSHWDELFDRNISLIESASTMLWDVTNTSSKPKIKLNGTTFSKDKQDSNQLKNLKESYSKKKNELKKIKETLYKDFDKKDHYKLDHLLDNEDQMDDNTELSNKIKESFFKIPNIEELVEPINAIEQELTNLSRKIISLEKGKPFYIIYKKNAEVKNYFTENSYAPRTLSKDSNYAFSIKEDDRHTSFKDKQSILSAKKDKFNKEFKNSDIASHDEYHLETNPNTIEKIVLSETDLTKTVLDFAEKFGIDISILNDKGLVEREIKNKNETENVKQEKSNIEKRTDDLNELLDRVNVKKESIVFFTGKPGVGKTHTLARFIIQQKAAGKNVLSVAKTNKAKDILGAYPGVNSTTIDKALRINPAMGIKETPDNVKTLFEGIDIIIIDEIQMLDQEDLNRLKQFFPNKQIILSGDPYQTPMNNAETESGISPIFSMSEFEKGMVLTGRIRQGETNPILSLADDITTIIDGKKEPNDLFEGIVEEWDNQKQTGVKYEQSVETALDNFLLDLNKNPNTRIITFNNENNDSKELSVYNITRRLAEKLKRDVDNPLIAGDTAMFYKPLRFSNEEETRLFTSSEEVTVVDNTPDHFVIKDENDKIYILEKNKDLDLQPNWVITSNKSTGSSYSKVYALVDNILSEDKPANFRYLNTAITRAKEGVVMVSEKYTDNKVDRSSEYNYVQEESIPNYVPTIDEKLFEPEPIYTAEVIAPARFPLSTGGFVNMLEKNEEDGSFKYFTTDEETGAKILRPEMFDKQTLEMLSYRIPTSSHQSIVQLKIVGFSNSSDQFIVDPSSLPFVGEDNDGDARKTFHQFTTTDDEGRIIIDNPNNPVTPEQRKKVAQNKLYRTYASVYKSGNKKILEASQKILSTQVAENSVSFIEESKINDNSNRLPAGSSKARFKTMQAGSVGKIGIGIHSLYVRIASEIQKYNEGISESKKFTCNILPVNGITLGGFYKSGQELFPVNNVVHRPTGTTSKNAEQGAENQNIATDNANLGLMDKRGETKGFIIFFAAMQAIGIYKLKHKGKEVDYASALFSNPKVREIFTDEKLVSELLEQASSQGIFKDDMINLKSLTYEKLLTQTDFTISEQIQLARLFTTLKSLTSAIRSLTDRLNAKELIVTGGFDNIYDKDVLENYTKNEDSFTNLDLFMQTAEFDKTNQSKELLEVVINNLDLKTNEGVNVRKKISTLTRDKLNLADFKSYIVSNPMGLNATQERDRLTLKGSSLGEYLNKYKTHPALYNNVFIQKLFGSNLSERFTKKDGSERIIIDYEDQGSTDQNNILIQESEFSKLHESDTKLPPFQGKDDYTTKDLAIDLMIYSIVVDGYVAGPRTFIRRIAPEYFDRLGVNDALSKIKDMTEEQLTIEIKQALDQKNSQKKGTPRFRTYDREYNTKPVNKTKVLKELERRGVIFDEYQNTIFKELLSLSPGYTNFVFDSKQPDSYRINTIHMSKQTMEKANSENSFDQFFYTLMEETAHSVINTNLKKYWRAFTTGGKNGRDSFDYLMGKQITETYKFALETAQNESWWSEEKFTSFKESLKKGVPPTITTKEEEVMYALTTPLELYAQVAAKRPGLISYLDSKVDLRYSNTALEKVYNTVTELIKRVVKVLYPDRSLKNLSILETIESELVFLPKKTAKAAKLEAAYQTFFSQRDILNDDIAELKNLPKMTTKAYVRLIHTQTKKDC